jgi:hypothetical protein
MERSPEDYYNKYLSEYLNRLQSYSDLEVIKAFNREVGNGGWGTARAAYLEALQCEFERREIDNSNIKNGNSISYAKRISLYNMNGEKFVRQIE